MAQVFSLVCWGGANGKSVAVSSSTDLVTLTNHGLRNATGVVFTSGTLPTVSGTALALNTTYYAKSISSSTFELYYDSSLTSKIDFTSTGSSLVMKSAYYLALSDKSRWTTGGVERIYDGIAGWRSARLSVASETDQEVCELGQAFTEVVTSGSLTLDNPGALLVTSIVNGVRSEAYHQGKISVGSTRYGYVMENNYTYNSTAFVLTKQNSVLDGFTIMSTRNDGYSHNGISLGTLTTARKMICVGVGNSIGIASGNASTADTCVVTGYSTGFMLGGYSTANIAKNCTFTKCAVGVNRNTAYPAGAYLINNISVGNTLNWQTQSGTEYATHNAGESGDVTQAYATGSNPRIIMSTADFKSWGTSTPAATDDYSPSAATSAQVETGTSYFGILPEDAVDVSKPAYPGSAYNTAVTAGSFVTGLSYTIASVGTTDFTLIGASANTVGVTFKATGVGTGDGTATLNARIDIGAYEFDLGYGAWPATATVTFSGVPAGSEIRVFDNTATEIAGIESCAADQVLTWGIPANPVVRIVIIDMAHRIKEFNYTSSVGAQSIPAQSENDKWYANPA